MGGQAARLLRLIPQSSWMLAGVTKEVVRLGRLIERLSKWSEHRVGCRISGNRRIHTVLQRCVQVAAGCCCMLHVLVAGSGCKPAALLMFLLITALTSAFCRAPPLTQCMPHNHTLQSFTQFDGAAVKAALQHAQQGGGGDDFDAAVNRAATEVFSALDAALDAK